MKFYGFVLVTLFSLNCFGQKADLIKYFDACKTIEFEESQQIMRDYSFGIDDHYTISEYSTIDGLTFKADLTDIIGYKAIVTCKVKNKAGSFIEKRLLVVMYYDKLKKHYSIFGMREAADAKKAFIELKEKADSGFFYTKREYDYRNISWWAMMNGQIKEAKKYIELAVSSANDGNNREFSTENIDVAIQRIL